ncbi:hypothetical protein FOMA001_g8915 [Fusarium oxysporum f. sp. matthiolae]|nr:hypothetical protein FOMA001_g8915 [Fusarium oxysporum f. sp. matthiolae]
MLKQRRSTRQPRTHAGSGGDSEVDASPASRDTSPLYMRYHSELDIYNELAKKGLRVDLEERSRLRGELRERINRTEKERRISPQGQSYHRVRRPQIQSGSSNQNGEDDYYEIDHSGRPSNRTFNPTRTPSPFRDYTYFFHEYPRAADIVEGLRALPIKKTDSDYDVDPRNLGPFNRTYKPSRTPSPSQGYTSYSRSYGDLIEATPSTNRPHIYKQNSYPESMVANSLQSPGLRESILKIQAAQKATDETIQKEEEERKRVEELALGRFEKALQEEAEAKAADANKGQEEAERLWRAEYPECPRGRLRAMRSFSKLYNKDTISRDSTTGSEARMDDLLACMGKKMMRTPFLKEPRGESSNYGEELGGLTMEYKNQLPRAKPPADRSKPSLYSKLGEGSQRSSLLIIPTHNTEKVYLDSDPYHQSSPSGEFGVRSSKTSMRTTHQLRRPVQPGPARG